MKISLALVSVFGIAITAFGQTSNSRATTKPKQSTPTRIGNHRLGESFNEWLAAEETSIDALCKTGAWANLAGQSSREDRYACDALSPIPSTGEGYFHDRRGLPADAEEGTRWTFAKGKFVGEQNIYSTSITTQELGFLKEAYGPPATITKIPQQNAFGAKWNDVLMTWHLPMEQPYP